MRTMGVREYVTAMAATGTPYGQRELPEFWREYRSKTGSRRFAKLVIRLRTMAEIGLLMVFVASLEWNGKPKR